MIPIEIQDLADAYRKVKVDLFYSGNPCRKKLVAFEDNLAENLEIILNSLLTKDRIYLFEISKGYWLCPKKIEFKDENTTIHRLQNMEGEDLFLLECLWR